jgi:hypothetical protein
VRGVRCDVDHGQEARQAGDHRQHGGNELQARKSLQTGAQGSAGSGLSFCPYGKTNRVLLAADRARSDARVVSAADRFGSTRASSGSLDPGQEQLSTILDGPNRGSVPHRCLAVRV